VSEPSSTPAAGPPAPVWRWGDAEHHLEAVWRAGGIVAIPTESSYGLAVDPADPRGVEAILRCKGRGEDRPLPVVAGALADLERLGARFDSPLLAPVLAAWPAPLTVVVPLERPLAAALGRPTIAVRVPAHAALASLLRRRGRAVTATSANRSGEPAMTTPAEVRRLLAGELAVVIDDGELPGGAPSTLVAPGDGALVVLRQGRYSMERILGR
jgi:L-threonylcarbamoyladenylate synthase